MGRYDSPMSGSLTPAARTIAAVILLFVVACGFTSCETPIERERRELRELTESPETVLYRGLKIALRSAPVEPGAAIDPSASEIRRLSAGIFTRLLRPAESSAGVATLAPRDYIALAQEFGTSIITRIDGGEDVSAAEREEARTTEQIQGKDQPAKKEADEKKRRADFDQSRSESVRDEFSQRAPPHHDRTG